MAGFLSVEHDELVGRCRAAHLGLDLDGAEDLGQAIDGDLLLHAREGGLAGGGVVPLGAASHPEGSALGLAERLGEDNQILLPAWRSGQVRQQLDGEQAPQGVRLDPGPQIRYRFGLFDHRAQLPHGTGAARQHRRFHHRQRRGEVFGL